MWKWYFILLSKSSCFSDHSNGLKGKVEVKFCCIDYCYNNYVHGYYYNYVHYICMFVKSFNLFHCIWKVLIIIYIYIYIIKLFICKIRR